MISATIFLIIINMLVICNVLKTGPDNEHVKYLSHNRFNTV